MSYRPVVNDLYHRAAYFVDRVVEGEDGPSPKKPSGVGRYGVGASVAAWLMSCWAASHWPARRVRAVSRIASALAN